MPDDVRPTAPTDLLAACRELLGFVESEYGIEPTDPIRPEEADGGWCGAIYRARLAIAKYAPEPEVPCPPTSPT